MIDALSSLFGPRRPLVAVVPLAGAIMGGGRIGRSFDDAAVAPLLERAFSARGVSAVALAINCPGGSPAQSSMIGARIRRLADEKKVPVHAFCQDVAASGGYWLACAADEIHADATSILGSIGVISAGFGFHDALARLGVERRVHTAGARKAMWDPFRPEDPEDVERLLGIQREMHATFIDWVRTRRGGRLAPGEHFTGEVWLGAEAQRRGLIDGIGHLVPVMRAKLGDKTRFRVFGPRRGLFERLTGGAAASLAGAVADEIEARALRARFGL